MGYVSDSSLVPDVDWPAVGVGAGAGAEKAGPILEVGSGEGLSDLTGLVKRGPMGRGGPPRMFKANGDRVGLPSAMSHSLLLASLGDYAAATAGTMNPLSSRAFTVQTGEDIVSKIISFCTDQGPRAVCVLSATGWLSSATVYEFGPVPSTKYDGRFEIMRFTGIYSSTRTGRSVRRLKISLANPNGQVFGGDALVLIAAEPVQLVLGDLGNPIPVEAALLADNYIRAGDRIINNRVSISGVLISDDTDGDGDTCTAPTFTPLAAIHGGAGLGGGVPGAHISKMTGGDDGDDDTIPLTIINTEVD